MRRLSMRELRRLMQHLTSMGIDFKEVKGVSEVVIRFSDGREWVIKNPQTSQIKLPQGNYVLQIVYTSSNFEERSTVQTALQQPQLEISEEDVKLVAEQAGVSLEEARQAIIEAGGDLALAIVKLQERKRG